MDEIKVASVRFAHRRARVCSPAVTRPVVWAVAVCLAAAALEGVLAGRGVRRRLTELRQPRYSPPFAVWVAIGVGYYVIAAVVLARALDAPPSGLRWIVLSLISALLLMNALWNLAFFRLKHLTVAAIIAVAYAPVAVSLMALLAGADPVSAWVFLPYVVYLGYAAWWILSLRRLNRT